MRWRTISGAIIKKPTLNQSDLQHCSIAHATPWFYDNIMLEIVCKENKLQVVIDAENLITSQGSSFDLEYQIDEKDTGYDSNENISGLQAQRLFRRVRQTHG